uniref:Type I restriction-modification system methyltransferase n=1 Tax=Pithovirus LCPAC102 TaxID=2506587 RepID=A0A481Z6B6_9VIRU|nr:MAG: type I restriction-modification system methyltransferase [Pithovirus LCPAC102]
MLNIIETLNTSILPSDITDSIITKNQQYLNQNINITAQKLWIQLYSGMDSSIEALISLIFQGRILFPFANLYVENSKILFDNIKKYRPVISNSNYKLQYKSWHGLFLPPLYKGIPIKIISGLENYKKIDVFTDLYTEDIRIQGKKIYATPFISSAECWTRKECLKNILIKLLKTPELSNIGYEDLREAIYLTSPEPGLFKITNIKGILETVLNVKLGESIPLTDDGKRLRWLDFSAGWGDRLAGSLAFRLDYVGFDPNKKLYNGHNRMITEFGNIDNYKIYYQPFESVNLKYITSTDGLFDICFTSPPYFNLEIYTDDDNQSINAYPTFMDWMIKFLFASLKKAWNGLKMGGYLILYIDDVKDGPIIEPMNLYIEQYLQNSSWVGIIGLEGSAKKVRPVFVWQKSETVNKWNNPNNTKIPEDRSLLKLFPQYANT